MKILVITHSLVPTSGWGRYSLEMVEALRAAGHHVDVVTDAGKGAGGEYTLRTADSLVSLVRNAFHVRKMSQSYSIVHALDGWPYGVYGYACVWGTGRKLFINGVGTYSVAPLKHWFKGFLLRFAYRSAAQVFCISRYVQSRILSEVSLSNTRVVHLGVADLRTSAGHVGPEAILRTGKAVEHGPVFLTVGAIKKRKGQLTSLKALNIIKAEFPGLRYILVGSDADAVYVGKIRDYAAEHGLASNVMIYPEVDTDEELSQFYYDADVFLLNSENVHDHFEGFGLVVVEAGRFGIPAVGSRECGIEDAIDDGVTGLLANQGDPTDIAGKIRAVLSQREEMGQNAAQFSRRFTWDAAITAYEEGYSQG
jgi:glycosyltransferase involved in cell wall biosynthesis